MALKDITDKVSPVWQALKGIATGSKIISSEWNTVIENIAERTQYLRRRGVCDWDSTLSYSVGDYVQVSGVVYKSLAANANKAPSSNPTYWEKCLMVAGEIAYTDEPEANGTASAGTAAKYARGDHVHPTDTSRAGVASFANVKTASGYQRFEGGMIMQWGNFSVAAAAMSSTLVTFPIAFPLFCLHGIVNVDNAATDQLGTISKTKTGMTIQKGTSDTAERTGTWIAIGY